MNEQQEVDPVNEHPDADPENEHLSMEEPETVNGGQLDNPFYEGRDVSNNF